MEQSIATYPRIVVDDVTKDIWADECAPDTASAHLKSLVKKDCDGQHFLDVFFPQWDFYSWTDFDMPSSLAAIPSDPGEFLTAAFKQIREGLETSGSNTKVHAKYMWLATECQSHAAALGLKL